MESLPLYFQVEVLATDTSFSGEALPMFLALLMSSPACCCGSRGVDIPAAEVALIPNACAELPSDPPAQATAQQVGSFSRSDAANCYSHPSSSPDEYSSTSGGSTSGDGSSGSSSVVCAPRMAYSSAHLVPLPIPDLSMAFNVCCFTSTVLAVYFGGVLNTLVR